MAGTFGDHLESGVLNHVFGGYTYTPPANIYIALSRADPTDDGTGLNEPAFASGYQRLEVANNKTSWTYANANALANAIDFVFTEATGPWGTITHFALYAESGVGSVKLLGHADLTTPKSIDAGDSPKFAAGDLDIQLN